MRQGAQRGNLWRITTYLFFSLKAIPVLSNAYCQMSNADCRITLFDFGYFISFYLPYNFLRDVKVLVVDFGLSYQHIGVWHIQLYWGQLLPPTLSQTALVPSCCLRLIASPWSILDGLSLWERCSLPCSVGILKP